MTATTPKTRQHEIPKAEFLHDINKVAIYALARGASFFFISHLEFLVSYVKAWLNGYPQDEDAAAEALFKWLPKRIRPWTLRLYSSQWIPEWARWFLLVAPLVLRLFLIVPFQFLLSSFESSWGILRKGVRGIPPLITAVVVVFVTSDAWKILGTGFTFRFFALVIVFLAVSLMFLVHKDYWKDIGVDGPDAVSVLDDLRRPRLWAVIRKISLIVGIKTVSDWAESRSDRPFEFMVFVDRGIQPLPVKRPTGFGAFVVRAGYIILSAFSLIVTAIFVSIFLIIVGLILINKGSTNDLAHTVSIYQTFPGNVVVTKQLLSVSLSLGAFSAFVLVASQRPEERAEFMRSVLVRYQGALQVYSIYCHAQDLAEGWTGVPVKIRPRLPETEGHQAAGIQAVAPDQAAQPGCEYGGV
jgi:hypothetical protein